MNQSRKLGSVSQTSHGWRDEGTPRRRILISAYHFSPVQGSEEGVGWNICSRLAAHHDVTVLTRSWSEQLWPDHQKQSREAEQYMRENGPVSGLSIHFVDSPALSRLLQPHPHVSLRSPFYFQGYAAWQRAAYREADRLHRQRRFELAHQLTNSSFREPGYLWKLDIPFVWGPIAGGGNIPWSYFSDFSRHDRLYYPAKNVANRMHAWTKWRSRIAARQAERVFVSGAELLAMIARWGGSPHIMLEAGTPPWEGRRRCHNGRRPLHLCWIGLHVGRKGLPVFLRALAELMKRGFGERVHLTILGTGPETHAWQVLCRELGVQRMTTWLGQVPFRQVRALLDTQDAFVMSSLQEGTPNVVMEALAAGLPVICHDISGMSFAVDESCGRKIPLRDRQTSIAGFADAVAQLATTQGLLDRLSDGALRRARQLSWDAKVKEIMNVYDAILQ